MITIASVIPSLVRSDSGRGRLTRRPPAPTLEWLTCLSQDALRIRSRSVLGMTTRRRCGLQPPSSEDGLKVSCGDLKRTLRRKVIRRSE